VFLASLLVSGVSAAADRVLLQREYYSSTNPEIMRVVGQIYAENDRKLHDIAEEFHRLEMEIRDKAEKEHPDYWDDPRVASELKKLRDDLDTRRGEVSLETGSKLFDVLERTAPYLAFECVVARGSSEESHTVVHGLNIAYHVEYTRFEEGMPWLVVTDHVDRSGLWFADEDARPFPLTLPLLAEWLGFGGKDPVNAAFERASLAPDDRPNGCTVRRRGLDPIGPLRKPDVNYIYSPPPASNQ